ncbi:hypothetical protein D3C72_1275350 [compost metagenome]
MQVVTGTRAASEQQAVDIRAGGQRLTGFTPALHQIENPIGQAGLLPQLQGFLGSLRRQFTRLEHHGVARQQRRHDVAIRQMSGEVIRAEHRQYAVRAVAQHRSAVRHRSLAYAGTRLIGLQ